MVTVLIGTIATVWPSGFERATNAVPMPPFAPGLFSTTTGTPSDSAIFGAMSRLRMSPSPPGGYGLTMVTGCPGTGNGCAKSGRSKKSENNRSEPKHALPPWTVS